MIRIVKESDMRKLCETFAVIFAVTLMVVAQIETAKAQLDVTAHDASEYAISERPGQTFAVTITNLTRGQMITPPIVFSHETGFELFTLGAPASPELAALAEDGDLLPLMMWFQGVPEVYDYQFSSTPLFPGESITIKVVGNGEFQSFTAAGMLATTNDAFFAATNVAFPYSSTIKTVDGVAYDAGSEFNSESCDFIPGAPCGNAGIRDRSDSEGFVYVHSGIHGNIDLQSEAFDWNNPVALVTVRRVLEPVDDVIED